MNLIVGQLFEGECDIVVDVARDLSVVETLMCEGPQSGGTFRFNTTREGQLTRNRSVMNFGVNPAEIQEVFVWNEGLDPDEDDPSLVVIRRCIIEGTAIKKMKRRDRDDDDDEEDENEKDKHKHRGRDKDDD